MANLKRVPTWSLVEELITREGVAYSKGNTSAAITVKNIDKKASGKKKEGNE